MTVRAGLITSCAGVAASLAGTGFAASLAGTGAAGTSPSGTSPSGQYPFMTVAIFIVIIIFKKYIPMNNDFTCINIYK